MFIEWDIDTLVRIHLPCLIVCHPYFRWAVLSKLPSLCQNQTEDVFIQPKTDSERETFVTRHLK